MRAAEVGPYALRRRLWRGAAGELWLADGAAGAVALRGAVDAAQRPLLLAEAALRARLDTAALARPSAADPEGAWLALPPLEGEPIHRWAVTRPLAERAEALAKLLDAVGALHRAGFSHGSLQPSDVLVDAQGLPHLVSLAPGALTPYSAPEQIEGGPPTPAADIYALGGIGYRMLTGHPPFIGVDPDSSPALRNLPLPPAALAPRLPEPLDVLLLRMLARRPAGRPETAALLARSLRNSLGSPPRTPILGMNDLRRKLRQLLLAACDGAAAVAVLVGPAGAGRRTLIEEILAAGRREGLVVVLPAGSGRPWAELRGLLRRPFVLHMEAPSPDILPVVERVRAEGLAGLVLVRSERSLPELETAINLPVPRLEKAEIASLLELAGGDPARADMVALLTGGRPGRVVPAALRARIPGDLGPRERALMLACDESPRPISALALRLGCDEAGVRALAAPLQERGLLQERAGALRAPFIPAK